MPPDRVHSSISSGDLDQQFLEQLGHQRRCTVCPGTRQWMSNSAMKRHVTTRVHQLALTEAQIRAMSVDSTSSRPPVAAAWAASSWLRSSAENPVCSTSAGGTAPCAPAPLPASSSQMHASSPFSPPPLPQFSAHPPSIPGGSTSSIWWNLSNSNVESAGSPSFIDRHQFERDSGTPACDSSPDSLDDLAWTGFINEEAFHSYDDSPSIWAPGDADEPELRLSDIDSDTYPWPDRTHFLTHLLFRSPRLRFSRSQQEAVLNWARSCGMDDTPTLYSLQKCDTLLRECGGDTTRKFKSSTGDVYFLNSIKSALRQDLSNIELREKMEFYPTDGESGVNEVWDGEKLSHGLCPEQLTPMVTSETGTQYFVNELCGLVSGEYFIPEMFLRRQGSMWARGYNTRVEYLAAEGKICINPSSERSMHPISEFQRNCVEIYGDHKDLFYFSSGSTKYQDFMPHPLRIKADGRPIYSLPFIVFQDDVSGNRSKQWNEHYVIYASNAGLPRKELNKPSNIRFVGASTHSEPLEMMNGICQMFQETFEDPVLAWDAKDEREVYVCAYMLCISADNPMHANHCSSTGLNSTYFCRTCKAGGSQVHRQSQEGFVELFKPGDLRCPQETLKEIDLQYKTAYQSSAVSRLATMQRKSGVKDVIAQPILERIQRHGEELSNSGLARPEVAKILRHEFEKNKPTLVRNPLLDVPGFNVHLDTPTEILHTILLGAAKYLWTFTTKYLGNGIAKFFTRFNCLSISGLEMDTTRIPGYISEHPGSITGTHFRFILQLAVFALHDLVEPQLFRVWLSLGRLTVLMWQSSIPELEAYIAELTEAIDDFLHATAVVDPGTITSKAKLHILTHAPFHVRRFGPLLGPDSERFESFNSVFRTCSILSNREAPSRDIARALAGMDMIRHIALGGRWFDEDRNMFVSPGPVVRDYFIHHPTDRYAFGLHARSEALPGTVAVRTKPAHFKSKTWTEALKDYGPCPDPGLGGSKFNSAESLIVQNGNKVIEGSNVIYRIGPQLRLGRVIRIAAVIGAATSYIIIKPFTWADTLDSLFKMPVVTLQECFEIVPGQDIVCHINLQHHCSILGCDETGSRPVEQEREKTNASVAVTKHTDAEVFLVNTHSMTNSLEIYALALSNACSPPSAFTDPASRAEMRRIGVTMLDTQTEAKAQKKVNAGDRAIKALAKRSAQRQHEGDTTDDDNEGNAHEENRSDHESAVATTSGARGRGGRRGRGGEGGPQSQAGQGGRERVGVRTRGQGRGRGRGRGQGRGRGRGRGGHVDSARNA